MEKFIIANGVALRVSDTGAAEGDVRPTIVLLHGYLESIEVWEEFTALLRPHLRVIALDLPGHGISEVVGEVHTMEFLAGVVNAAVRESGVDSYVVCGHSMGGYVALEVLRNYPESVAGIVLFHSVAMADSDEKQENRRREIEVVLAGKKDLLAVSVAKSFAAQNRKRFADRIEELSDQVYLTEDAGVVALLRGMGGRRDNDAMLAESAAPQMFIFGRNDDYISQEIAAEEIRLNPQARVVWLENSGHMGFIEEPRASADAILDFCTAI